MYLGSLRLICARVWTASRRAAQDRIALWAGVVREIGVQENGSGSKVGIVGPELGENSARACGRRSSRGRVQADAGEANALRSRGNRHANAAQQAAAFGALRHFSVEQRPIALDFNI